LLWFAIFYSFIYDDGLCLGSLEPCPGGFRV
jgi:hypothetical protein